MSEELKAAAIIYDQVKVGENEILDYILVINRSGKSGDWIFPEYSIDEGKESDYEQKLQDGIQDEFGLNIDVKKEFISLTDADSNTTSTYYICDLIDKDYILDLDEVMWIGKEEFEMYSNNLKMIDIKVIDSILKNWNSIFSSKDKILNGVKHFALDAKDKAGKAADVLKIGGQKIGRFMAQTKIDMDKARYNPVFKEDYESPDYKMPDLLQIVEYDKRMEIEACKGAIGFENNHKGLRMLTLYKEEAKDYGMRYYPNFEETIFFVHPFDNNYYISLDNYFSYIKKNKVDELERIAYKLGAKYVKITFKEERISFVSDKKALTGKGKKGTTVTADVKIENSEKEYTNFYVGAETKFNGNSIPERPELVYFKDESDIKNLIEMRMNNPESIKSKTYSIKYNSSSSIKEREAIKIDAILKALKLTGNASIVSEIQKENRLMLEYHIEF